MAAMCTPVPLGNEMVLNTSLPALKSQLKTEVKAMKVNSVIQYSETDTQDTHLEDGRIVCFTDVVQKAEKELALNSDGTPVMKLRILAAPFKEVYETRWGTKEKFDPTCFDQTMQDIADGRQKMVLSGDSHQVHATNVLACSYTKEGEGSLKLYKDKEGLWIEAILLRDVQRVSEAIWQRVDLDWLQASVGMYVNLYEVDNDEEMLIFKEVTLFETSIVPLPAFKQTSITQMTEGGKMPETQADLATKLLAELKDIVNDAVEKAADEDAIDEAPSTEDLELSEGTVSDDEFKSHILARMEMQENFNEDMLDIIHALAEKAPAPAEAEAKKPTGLAALSQLAKTTSEGGQ